MQRCSLLLWVAVVCTAGSAWIGCSDGALEGGSPTPAATETPEATVITPTPPDESPSPEATPGPTPVVTPDPTAVPTPASTLTPTPTPSADGDIDQDGFPAVGDGSHPVDCDDTDPSRHPGAEEVPYDGVDQDCDGFDLIDADEDAQAAVAAGGDDCDDEDATIYTGAKEVPYDGVDQDCDGFDLTDVDGDGYDAVEAAGDDCDDSEANSHPGATEFEDDRDNDCDGRVDDELDTYDDDGDGRSETAGDCNDSDPSIFPGATETPYDGIDQDCSGVDLTDQDGDGSQGGETGADCDDEDGSTYPGALELPYDGVDQDCSGADLVDVDGDGFASSVVTGGLDCDDTDAKVNPGAVEVCDGRDNDCDGRIDTGAVDVSVWYADVDEDGYGDSNSAVLDCTAPAGYVASGSDCDDQASTAYPGGVETCDGLDNDCDAQVDEGLSPVEYYPDLDGDGYGAAESSSILACGDPEGYAADPGDCDDLDPDIYPGADEEVGNGSDDDCDGFMDTTTTVAGMWSLKVAEDGVMDSAGNLIIADTGNHRIVRIDAAGDVTRLVGLGTPGFSGDGGPATDAQLNSPNDVALDSAGNLYIADSANHRVRRVSTDGVIVTFAGTGVKGYSGDGVSATLAQLSAPGGVAVDGEGTVFIADTGNFRVRKVTTSLIIATVAGTGTSGYSGDGGPATAAKISHPLDVTVDGVGSLYFPDLSSRVRKVDTSGIITTVAGTGTAGYSGDGGSATKAQLSIPNGTATDVDGNLLIADTTNGRIRRVSPSGTITTFAGTGVRGYSGDTGPATLAQLNSPSGVFLNNSGTLYIVDKGNLVVRKVTSGVIDTVTGTRGQGYAGDGGPATSAWLYAPYSVLPDNAGNLYIADSTNNRIRKIDPSGIITTVVGNGIKGYAGDGGPASAAQLNTPRGLAFDSAGALYIADTGNNCVRKVTTSGEISTMAGTGTQGYGGDGGPATLAYLYAPGDVVVDGSGTVFIADGGNSRLRQVSAGTISTIAGTGTTGYSGDGGPATAAQLDYPAGITLDATGNLYFSDGNNRRIRRVSSAGVITTVAGNGSSGFSGDGGPATAAQLGLSQGLWVDGAGSLYIADTTNNRIRRVSPSGIINTVAGQGSTGFDLEGVSSTEAQFYYPQDIVGDSRGDLYVADRINNLIRRIVP